MSPDRTLSVPIVHLDLRQEETIVQIAVALDYLNQAVHNTFQHINTSISNNRARLAKLKQRSETVQAKVTKLSGTNKATKVFSCAKYPASDVHKDYKNLFQPKLLEVNETPVKIKSPLISHDLEDKKNVFHVKKVKSKMMRKNAELVPEKGLGGLPKDVEYISSLLLFNTQENLYKDYVMSDPLHVIMKSRKALEGDDGDTLEAAPMTMSTADQMSSKEGGQYFYSPILKEVPVIDVPLDLPDLPGIADDLRYSMEADLTIAPSSSTPAIADLPALLLSPAEPDQADAPPPPPPPPVSLPDLPPHIAESVDATASPPLPPPPPPPPPPIEQPGEIAMQGTESARGPSSVQTPTMVERPKRDVSGDPIANLMEAIRNAGGSGKAKLRSVTERKQEAKQIVEQDEGTAPPSGNLMADLHAKLTMRRKGISGQRAEGGETAIEKMFAKPIPPIKGSETEDEDWDEG